MADKATVQSPLRRGLKALAVFAVVLFLFGGSAGFVAAKEESIQAREKELVIPYPAVGQAADFSIKYHEATQFQSEVYHPMVSYELLDRMPLRYQDGSLREAFVVQFYGIDTPHSNAADERMFMDPATMHWVAREYEFEDTQATESSDDQTWTTDYRAIQYHWPSGSVPARDIAASPSCLHMNLFLVAEEANQLNEPVSCSILERLLEFSNETGAELIGWSRTNGYDAFQIRITDDATGGLVDIWYASGVPGAVRVDYSAPSQDGGLESATIRLENVQLGDPDHALSPTIIEPALEPIGFDATMEHWPDDSDFESPFRLVDAMEVAMNWPGSELATYLEENPEAYAHMFWLFNHEDDTTRTHSWYVYFRADDPDNGLRVSVDKKVPRGTLVGDAAGDGVTHRVYFDAVTAPLNAPPPSMRPKELPSFQDAYDWSKVFFQNWSSESEPSPTVMGFISCWSGCDSPMVSLTVGDSRMQYSQMPNLPLSIPGQEDAGTIYLGQDSIWIIDGVVFYASSYSFTLDNAPAPSAPDPDPVRTHSAPETVISTIQWTPPNAAATGVSFGVALLTGMAYYVWPSLKQFIGVGLFSRLKTPTLLEHPARNQIHAAVQHVPGIRFAALAEQTGLPNGTLRHHLHMLVDAGLVARREENGYTCYFIPKDATPENLAKAGAVQSDGARTVLDYVLGHPGTTARSISDATGLAVGTVGYHIKKLRDAGLIDSQRDGRQVRLMPIT